jgi:excisionase family DNA binding protein
MSEYLTVDQAATLLHVSPQTIRRWIFQGKVRASKIKTGKNGRVLINKSDLAQMLESKSRQSTEARKRIVSRILAFREQVAGRGLDADTLIDQHRQERDRESNRH